MKETPPRMGLGLKGRGGPLLGLAGRVAGVGSLLPVENDGYADQDQGPNRIPDEGLSQAPGE